jgi:hypothetical protein
MDYKYDNVAKLGTYAEQLLGIENRLQWKLRIFRSLICAYINVLISDSLSPQTKAFKRKQAS